MLNHSDDRRARRSRKLLKQGLLELMREKRFSEISVRDITERMDLNRGTFYLHYPNTSALLRSMEEDMLTEAQSLIDAHLPETVADGSLRPVFEPVLNYVVDKREICTTLFASDEASGFTDRLQQLIYRNGVEIIRAWFHPQSEEQLAYVLTFITYGLIGLLKEWFDRDMVLSQEELIQMASQLVRGATERLLASQPTHSSNAEMQGPP